MFAVLHIPDFPLHAVLRTEPGVAGKPAALFTGTGKKSLVSAANEAARASGVETGMTAPQAVARCARLVIRAPRPDAEAEARAALLAVGFSLSPAVEDTATGFCTIDVKGRSRSDLSSALPRAIAHLAALGLPAAGGVARTPLLALYAARAAAGALRAGPEPRVLLDIAEPAVGEPPASATLAFGGETAGLGGGRLDRSPVLWVDDEQNFLAPLPLAVADPSPVLGAVLAEWGLRTLGDLTALPRDEIVRRFGGEGLALWTRATGGASRPLHPVLPAAEFCATLEFESEIETLEPLLFILRRFLERLSLELRASQHVAAELELTLRLANDTSHARGFRLPEPTADVDILFRALHTHLESLSTAASICAVQLRAVPTRPLVRQQDLFETGLCDPHGFAETLARVSALVGADRVGTPQREDTHRPDAVKLVAPHAVIPPPAELAVHAALGLPLRRYRPPLPARVEFTDGQPTFLWTERVRGEIRAESKEWPSDGDWWQADRKWARSEWDITLVEGGVYRLLLCGDSYFLEGEYD